MTKSDIAERIAVNLNCTNKEALNHVESVLELVKETLANGDSLKISGFGKFEVQQKKDRKGRNPQTGEALTIAKRKILTFRPSALLKAKINNQMC